MLIKRNPLALGLLATALMLTTAACKTQPNHPNQINTFDGASYDSLTLAHGALASLRVQISANYRQYVSIFNEAAGAYSTAYNVYALYRTNPNNQAAVSVAISNLTVSIVSLEDAFQSEMQVSPQTVLKVRGQAHRFRSTAAPSITISDILAELEIAAKIAESVPGTQPYSTIAAIVISATQDALAAHNAASGQPIDLSTIQPFASIQ